ncbi:MAG: GIY-YIG nuclease family protein [Verrucomicrobiota bacterium]
MNLNDILKDKGIDQQHVLVLRHCFPKQPQLNKVVRWLAAEKPTLFNAIQQSHARKGIEGAVSRAKYVASFIGHEPGKALFVGLYSVKGESRISREQFWGKAVNVQLKDYGGGGYTEEDPRPWHLWFDLALMTDFYPDWKGKLIVNWPGKERSWYRLAHRNVIPIHAILEDSALDGAMPKWDEIDLRWEELGILPTRWKSKLREWRGVYYIFDTSDGKGYVGSAYGEDNLLGRWENYAATGHGGNRLLRQREPRNFRFTILELDAPNRNASDVQRLEGSWKQRLHTAAPQGLNEN